MTLSEFNRRLKPWMLPIAMAVGIVCHSWIGQLAFLSPWLIFGMLLITYSRISFAEFRLDRSAWWLLAAQIFLSLGAYFAINPASHTLAESIFICIICPTATAAPVITGMLGGKVEKVAAYSLLINLVVAIFAPLAMAYMESASDVSFHQAFLAIAIKVMPLLLGPLVVSIAMKFTVPQLRESIARHQGLSFYIWAVSLIIVVGTSVSFIMHEPPAAIPLMLAMALLSMIACIAQFAIGRTIGRRYGDPIAAAQSLGQKNTVLAIWMALTYFNPIASVGPACYVAWHNAVNSWQIYRKMKRRSKRT